MPFSVHPVLTHDENSPTVNLVADYGFNCAFTKNIERLNRRYHFCKVETVSDTQTSFVVNKGQKQKELLCVLYLVFVVVSDYDANIVNAWKSGLENILSKMSKLVFPGVDQIPNSLENLDLLESIAKWSLDNTLFLPKISQNAFNLRNNLDIATQVMEKVASLEKKNALTRLFNSSEIKRAKSYLVEIDKMRQKLSLIESEADNLLNEIRDYKKLEKFSEISFEEAQKKAKRLQDLDKKVGHLQISYCKIYCSIRKLASDYDLYLFYW